MKLDGALASVKILKVLRVLSNSFTMLGTVHGQGLDYAFYQRGILIHQLYQLYDCLVLSRNYYMMSSTPRGNY